MFANRKGVSDEPAPGSARLATRNLDCMLGFWLRRGYRPVRVHQCDIAGLDDLLDVEVKGRFG